MENRTLDYKKHVNVFNPVEWNMVNIPIHVVGCGATGSWLALALGKLGIKNLVIWDYDDVEEHNVPNQAYSVNDIGRPKTRALREKIYDECNICATMKIEKVDTNTDMSGIVFVLTDTMKSRKNIYNSIRHNTDIQLIIETRMDLRCGRVYTFNPQNEEECLRYKDTLYDDASSEVSACGVSQTVLPTCWGIVNQALWCFLRHINGDKPPFEIMADFENFWNVVNE